MMENRVRKAGLPPLLPFETFAALFHKHSTLVALFSPTRIPQRVAVRQLPIRGARFRYLTTREYFGLVPWTFLEPRVRPPAQSVPSGPGMRLAITAAPQAIASNGG